MPIDRLRRIDERAHDAGPRAATSARRAGRWSAGVAVLIGLALVTLASPTPASAAYTPARLTAAWGSGYSMTLVQESNRKVVRKGTWVRKTASQYLSNHALTSWRRGSRLKLKFTGTGIAVIGPTGPKRGKAQIWVDGRYVKTVTARSSVYRRQVPLFIASWSVAKTRTVEVVVLGSTQGSKFTVDAFAVRRPSPTPPPAAKPTPTPAPTQPTAKPTGASPFAAPVTTATYTVPASIDATGATDVSAALNAWIQGVPDGSVISFPAKGVYKLGKGIQLGNRHNLVFQGNGATLRASGAGSDLLSSLFVSGFSYPLRYWTGGTTHIAIRDFNLVGNDSTPGVYGSGGEGQAGFRSYATGYLEVSGCTISAVWGDGFFFHDSTNVWVHDNRVASAGRNGVTVISGSGVTAEGNKFDKIGYVTLDVEPNAATEASSDIVFRSNTAGTWGQDFVSVDGQHTGASIRNITVSGNTVTGDTLSTRINNGGGSRLRNIAVTNNTSRVAGRGPVLIFAHVDGLKVTGNVQPLTSGSLTSITDSTNVTYP